MYRPAKPKPHSFKPKKKLLAKRIEIAPILFFGQKQPRDSMTYSPSNGPVHRAIKCFHGGAILLLCLVVLSCDRTTEQEAPPDPQPGQALLEGEGPKLPTPLEGLEWGATTEQLQQDLPELGQEEAFEPEGYSDIAFAPILVDGKVHGVECLLAFDKAQDFLTQEWGPPVERDIYGSHFLFWYNPKAGLMARLNPAGSGDRCLTLQPYLPLEELFGATPTLPPPVAKLRFGMSEEEILTAIPEFEKSGFITPLEYPELNIMYFLDKDALSRLLLSFQYGDIREVLTQHWGQAQEGTYLEKPVYFWFNPDEGLRVSLESIPGSNLNFEPYLPVTQLIGTTGEELGFESLPLLGADLASATKAYAQWLNSEEPDGGFTLHLPPTEYGSKYTTVWISAQSGRVEAFRFSLDFAPYPKARDHIFAALVAKFGPARSEKDFVGHPLYLFETSKSLLTVQENTASQSWDIEVTSPAKP